MAPHEKVRPQLGGSRLRETYSGHLNRRELVQRGLMLGLAGPALAGATAMPTAAQTGETGPKGGSGTLVVTVSGDPLSFNPDFQVDDNGFLPCSNIYSMLMALDTDYNIVPDLAKSWQVAADGLSVTFNLVSGATWHDGKPLTSADVKYTFDTILANKSAPASTLLTAIKAVETPNDTTVVFRLKQPSASLLGFVSWYGVFILPAHIYQGTDWSKNPANQKPIGSGPFKFSSYQPGSSIELVANKDYWGEGPFLDKLVFNIIPDANTALQSFLNGEADVIDSPTPPLSQVSTLQKTAGVKVALVNYPDINYIGFNMAKAPTSNVKVRKAIAQAINREQIVKTALSGYAGVATTFYTPVIAWAVDTKPDATAPPYDKAAAMAALDAAGYPVKNGTRFKLSFVYFTFDPSYGDIAAVVTQQLKAVNIDAELVALEIGAYGQRLTAGTFDIALEDGFQGPDPNNLKIRVGTGGSVNYWRYSNPQVDTLLNEADGTNDRAARAQKYFAVERILAQQLPIIPLTGVVVPYPYSDKVTGVPWTEAGHVGFNSFVLAKRTK